MGRYRKGHKHQRWHGKKQGSRSNDENIKEELSGSDWIVLENYLSEYRTKAYEAHNLGNKQQQLKLPSIDDVPKISIGSHQFVSLTMSICQRRYIDLPDTLSGKERRRVHEMCTYLDIYHAGVGSSNDNNGCSDTVDKSSSSSNPTDEEDGEGDDSMVMQTNPTTVPNNNNRRIAISIFVDGLDHFFYHDSAHDSNILQSFPSRSCRPWVYRINSNYLTIGDNKQHHDEQHQERLIEIEREKKLIHQFTILPEQSVRTFDSLDFSTLNILDLSLVPSPDTTPWMLVDTIDKLILCVDELRFGISVSNTTTPTSINSPSRVSKICELAFDLEMCNIGDGNSGTRTCLIQLTSNVGNKDYIIDPLALGMWDAISTYLGPLFSDPSIIKIGHGIGGMDCSSLHRDFGILVVNAFDTYEASAVLSQGKRGLGLAVLCRQYKLPEWERYAELKSTYQRSEWQKRPLNSDALRYGRYDIRYLITLRKLLLRDLSKMDMIGYVQPFNVVEDEDYGSSELYESTSYVNDILASDEYDVDQSEGDDESNIDNGSSMPPSSSITVIHSLEFSCYHHLMSAISLSQKRCLKLWSGNEVADEPILRNSALLSIIKDAANQKGHGKYWTDVHAQLYKKLVEWRKDVAQRELCTGADICSLDLLVFAAYKMPLTSGHLRRFAYILPELLRDDTLPYCNELCEIVTTTRQQHPPVSDMTSLAVVRYSDVDNDSHYKRQKIVHLLVGSALIGAIVIAMTRARNR
jgi:hypothetical protein